MTDAPISPEYAAYLNRCRRLHDLAAAALARATTCQLQLVQPILAPARPDELELLRQTIADMGEILAPYFAPGA
jgi:hypothetical protein